METVLSQLLPLHVGTNFQGPLETFRIYKNSRRSLKHIYLEMLICVQNSELTLNVNTAPLNSSWNWRYINDIIIIIIIIQQWDKGQIQGNSVELHCNILS